MGPYWALLVDRTVRLPRVSGDGPFAPRAEEDFAAVAPRERGWAQGVLLQGGFFGGCPA